MKNFKSQLFFGLIGFLITEAPIFAQKIRPYEPQDELIFFSEIPDYRNWEPYYMEGNQEEGVDFYINWHYYDDGTKEPLASVRVTKGTLWMGTFLDKILKIGPAPEYSSIIQYTDIPKQIRKAFYRYDEKCLTDDSMFCGLTKLIYINFQDDGRTIKHTYDYDKNDVVIRETIEDKGPYEEITKVNTRREPADPSRSSFRENKMLEKYNLISYSYQGSFAEGNKIFSLNAKNFSDGYLDKMVSMSDTWYKNKYYGNNFFISGHLVDRDWNKSFDPAAWEYVFGKLFNDIIRSHYYELDYYTIETCVNIFLDDLISHEYDFLDNKELIKGPYLGRDQKIMATFETLNEGVVAVSTGLGDDNLIKIKIDPTQWEKSSKAMRFYVLYHELGHDVLNLHHGEGGRMMFNFPTENYSWSDFYDDRDKMFEYYFRKKYN